MAAAACGVFFLGCAGYHLGARSLYAPDVQTVHVPMIDNHTLRRQLGERLTEAVVKQIALKTPYRLAGPHDADSILSVEVVSEGKNILVENPTDEGRQVQLDLAVHVAWLDRQGRVIGRPESMPLPPELTWVGQSVAFVPEFGQSVATAQQQAIERLAEQIVSLMEAPW
jgi:hypothetical protein